MLDPGHDHLRLVFFVARDEPVEGAARSKLAPEFFLAARPVVGDDRVGRGQDGLGGPVILFEFDDFCLRIVRLETENIADVGPAPPVDGLVVIAHHADVAMGRCQEPEQFVLKMVRVLVLVDHHVAQPFLIPRQNPGMLAPQAQGQQQQIVEVQGVGGPQRGLVFFEHRREPFGVFPGRLGIAVRLVFRHLKQAVVLHQSDLFDKAVRIKRFLHAVEVLEQTPHHGTDISLRRDGEVLPVAEVRDFGPQHAQAERMERRNDQFPPGPRTDERRHPFPHLARGLVGKGYREDFTGLGDALRENVRNTLRDHAGLAAARPREYQQRSFSVRNRLPLCRIQSGQECIHESPRLCMSVLFRKFSTGRRIG